jgi:hypothetical protein
MHSIKQLSNHVRCRNPTELSKLAFQTKFSQLLRFLVLSVEFLMKGGLERLLGSLTVLVVEYSG